MYIIHQKRKITYACIVAFIKWKAGRDYFIILNETGENPILVLVMIGNVEFRASSCYPSIPTLNICQARDGSQFSGVLIKLFSIYW